MTAPRAVLPTRSKLHTLAVAVSEACAPAVLVTVFLAVTAIGAAGRPDGVLYAVIAVAFTTALPLAAVIALVRSGRLTDHHISDRRQRAPVLAGTLVSIAAGLWILVLLDAPASVLAAVGCTVAGVVLVLLVNLSWKLSAHSAVAVFVTIGAVAIAGPAALLLLPMPVAVGWSRVRLRAHTRSQVAAGWLVGAAIGVAFTAITGSG